MQKTIFITGASSGLGKATAKLFHSKGWHVIATMRNPEIETELTKLSNVKVMKLDIDNSTAITQTVNGLLKENTVDLVLNNAGYGLVGPLEGINDEQITRQVNTNLLGTIRVTKEFLPHFRARKNGLFINITSMFGLVGYPTCSIYAATKFALDGFSESLAYELAHLNIKVKIIAPGGIQTDFTGRSMDTGMHDAYKTVVEKISEGYNEEKISRFSTPDHIARIVFEAATDNKEQLRYIAGNDAVALYNERIQHGNEEQYLSIKNIFDLK